VLAAELAALDRATSSTLLIGVSGSVDTQMSTGPAPGLSLANCYFAHNSLEFPVLLGSGMRDLVVLLKWQQVPLP
jgi:hypothetical protein